MNPQIGTKLGGIQGMKAVYEMFFGLLFGLELGFLMLLLTRKKGKIRAEYDERQELSRGRGYKWGFLTFGIFSLVMGSLSLWDIEVPVEQPIIWFGSLMLAITVTYVYFVWHDCLIGLQEEDRTVTIMLWVVLIPNLSAAVCNTVTGRVIRDGKLSIDSINYLFVFYALAILIARLARKAADKREADL